MKYLIVKNIKIFLDKTSKLNFEEKFSNRKGFVIIWAIKLSHKKLMEFLNYTFIKNALIAILLASPIFAIIGTMIVNNKMAFFSDALGHSALTGIAIGMLLGISNANISIVIFAIVFALILNYVKNKTSYGTDTIISVFSSIAMAIGLALLGRMGEFNKYSNYLVGDLLSISKQELVYLAIAFVLVIVFWIFTFNKINAISVNKMLAKSKGRNVILVDNLFSVVTAIIVMISIRWIGILLINSMVILPAASSRNISKDMREYHTNAIIIALVSGVLGLIISYYLNVPTGPMIVIILGIVYLFTFLLRKMLKLT